MPETQAMIFGLRKIANNKPVSPQKAVEATTHPTELLLNKAKPIK